ncbi:MAG: methyltransferase domain-containing protein, partial [Myxococcales bacterium]
GVSVALVALPMLLLGGLPPLLVQAARPAPDDDAPGALGRLSGQLSAAGTLGSLAGTFGAALVLLPALGTRATFDLAAAALLVTALLAALARRARRAAGLAAASLVALLALARRPVAWTPSRPGERVVWTGESRYNHIRVVERGGERQLRLNDGFAVQSYVRLDGQAAPRDVWAYYALGPTWGTAPAPGRVLLLGLGGGTSARVYRQLYPAAEVVGVELDGAVVEAGQRFLGLSPSDARVVVADARPFVEAEGERAPGSYDVIVLDAFQFPYVPFQLTTREFFAAVRRCLAPGGVLVVNAGRYGEERAVVHALARTLASVFTHVQSADPPGNRSNTILVATDHDPARARGGSGLAVSDATAAALRDLALRLPPPRPASWPPDAPRLTDDHAPVEWLTDRIVWKSL